MRYINVPLFMFTSYLLTTVALKSFVLLASVLWCNVNYLVLEWTGPGKSKMDKRIRSANLLIWDGAVVD